MSTSTFEHQHGANGASRVAQAHRHAGLAPTSERTLAEARHQQPTTASVTGRCVCCGRRLEAGDDQRRLPGGNAHAACASVATATVGLHPPASTALHRGTDSLDEGDNGPHDESASDTTDETSRGADRHHDRQCNHCYPNELVWESQPSLEMGECVWDVCFPGWATSVVAKNLAQAAEEAQWAVREFSPDETAVFRCSEPNGCGHPREWVPIYRFL